MLDTIPTHKSNVVCLTAVAACEQQQINRTYYFAQLVLKKADEHHSILILCLCLPNKAQHDVFLPPQCHVPQLLSGLVKSSTILGLTTFFLPEIFAHCHFGQTQARCNTELKIEFIKKSI